jgi:hypothetical protein
MKVYKTNHSFVVEIKNKVFAGQKFTNLSSFTKTNKGFTAIKHNTAIGYDMLINISEDFKTLNYYPIKTKSSNNITLHANSITYADDYLYIATMNNLSEGPTIIKVDFNGNVVDEYYFYKDNKKRTVTAIDYFGEVDGEKVFIFKGDFIASGSSYQFSSYDFVRISNKLHRFVYNGKTFKSNIRIPVNYIGNDITYDKENKLLYETYFIRDEDNSIKTSYIYAGSFNKDSNILNVSKQWKTTATPEDKMFEVEAFLVHKKKKYVVANCAKDGIYRIINL